MVGILVCYGAASVGARELDVGQGERLLVVAPHPDDETLGAGGLMQQVLERGGRVHVLLMTAGDGYREAVTAETHAAHPDPAQFIAYGERRLAEARAAVHVLGGGRVRVDVLGFPDGGLNALLGDHWWRMAPARSAFTGTDRPPYAQALDPHLRYAGIELRDTLVAVLRATEPTIIALPDWVDQHPDHSATGTFVMLAVDEWAGARARRRAAAPRLLAYLIHWPGWPNRPARWRGPAFPTPATTRPLQLPSDLPPRGLSRQTLTLSESEIATKSAALATYETQRRTNTYQLGVFVRRTEPFTVIDARALPRLQEAIHPVPKKGSG
jgi:LmbE family N-acetylglucosaminyl deacetylase